MSIILFLGKDVNEYIKKSSEKIKKKLDNEEILCDRCLALMKYYIIYPRKIKETGEKIDITFVICTKCKPRHGSALLPDFLLPYKQYSAHTIEDVIKENAENEQRPIKEIDTPASEPTVRRWIKQIGGRITMAVSKIKSIFIEKKRIISEINLEPGHCYNELKQLLKSAPVMQKHSGNKLGLANIWLSRQSRKSFI